MQGGDVSDDGATGLYSTMEELWEGELKNVDEQTGRPQWYQRAEEYWQSVPATVNGVLGGFAHLSRLDLSSSTNFLKRLLNDQPRPWVAVDCGAGIGRVTEGLLMPLVDQVDMVEVCPKFVEKAKRTLSSPVLGNVYCLGLQDFHPQQSYYDIVWSQWVLGHLTDVDLVAFLKRCKKALKPGGYVCVKENVCLDDFELDKTDSSVTRAEASLVALFKEAGLEIVRQQRQTGFPPQIFPVNMYALQ